MIISMNLPEMNPTNTEQNEVAAENPEQPWLRAFKFEQWLEWCWTLLTSAVLIRLFCRAGFRYINSTYLCAVQIHKRFVSGHLISLTLLNFKLCPSNLISRACLLPFGPLAYSYELHCVEMSKTDWDIRSGTLRGSSISSDSLVRILVAPVYVPSCLRASVPYMRLFRLP